MRASSWQTKQVAIPILNLPRRIGGRPGPDPVRVADDEPWVKVQSEGIFGRWHMTAGEGPGYVLTACDLRLREHVLRLDVDLIPANERCPVCQGQHQLRETTPEG